MALGALCLSACSSDDDNNNEPVAPEATNYASVVKGTYEGYTVASTQYFSDMVAASQTVKVTDLGNSEARIDFVSDTWGTILIEKAQVSKNGNTYLIEGDGTATMGMSGRPAQEYACGFSGTVTDGVAAYTFSLPAVMGGLTIDFKSGNVPATLVVPGTYTGWTNATCQYFPAGMTADGQTVTIAAAADGKFKVTYISDSWGEFTVEDVEAVYDSGTAVFGLTGTGSAEMGMNGSVSTYVCNFSGSVDVAKDAPAFKFVLPAVMGGLTIEFHPGEMPQE